MKTEVCGGKENGKLHGVFEGQQNGLCGWSAVRKRKSPKK